MQRRLGDGLQCSWSLCCAIGRCAADPLCSGLGARGSGHVRRARRGLRHAGLLSRVAYNYRYGRRTCCSSKRASKRCMISWNDQSESVRLEPNLIHSAWCLAHAKRHSRLAGSQRAGFLQKVEARATELEASALQALVDPLHTRDDPVDKVLGNALEGLAAAASLCCSLLPPGCWINFLLDEAGSVSPGNFAAKNFLVRRVVKVCVASAQ